MATALYRLFNKADVLLYVGVANRPPERLNTHLSLKRWWPEVKRTEIEWHPTRRAALLAERQVVLDENPLYNILIPGPDGRAKGSVVRHGIPAIALRNDQSEWYARATRSARA
jgi:GIY-YIG catalytic domain